MSILGGHYLEGAVNHLCVSYTFTTAQFKWTNLSLLPIPVHPSPLDCRLDARCAGCNSWVWSERMAACYPPLSSTILHSPPPSGSLRLWLTLPFPPPAASRSRGDTRTRFIHPGSVGFSFKHYDGERVMIKYWFCLWKNEKSSAINEL